MNWFLVAGLLSVGDCLMRLRRVVRAAQAVKSGKITEEEFISDIGPMGLSSTIESVALAQLLRDPSLATLQAWNAAWHMNMTTLLSCNPRRPIN